MTLPSPWFARCLVVAGLVAGLLLSRNASAMSPRLAFFGGGIYFDDDRRLGLLGGIRGTFFQGERVSLAVEGTFATTKETLALAVLGQDGRVDLVTDTRTRRFYPVLLSVLYRFGSGGSSHPYVLGSAGFGTTTVRHENAAGAASTTWSSAAFQIGLGWAITDSVFIEGSYLFAGRQGTGDPPVAGLPPSEPFRPGGATLRLGLRW